MITLNELYKFFSKFPLISTDTRQILPGSIYFALKGNNFNGNTFAKEAIKNGAIISIVDEIEYEDPTNMIFYVEDSLKMLQSLASFHRSKYKIPVLAITGTNGKTTTKELISTVICQEYNHIATLGNLNNHIGVPLTLLRINDSTEFAIIEMGANHIGEIKQLCEIAKPNFGIITNIGMAHLEGFGSYEGVIKAKSELYEYLNKEDGEVFVNSADDLLVSLSKSNKTNYYGSNSNITGKVINIDPTIEIIVNHVSDQVQEEIIIKTKLAGKYNLENILAAYIIGKYFNIDSKIIKTSIEHYTPQNIRSQVKITKANKIIIDAYNANLTSMHKAIESFAEIPGENKVLILGDMFELGEFSNSAHKEILNLITKLKFNDYLLVGKEFKKIIDNNRAFTDTTELISHLEDYPLVNKTILLKGSRGVGLEKLIDYL